MAATFTLSTRTLRRWGRDAARGVTFARRFCRPCGDSTSHEIRGTQRECLRCHRVETE